jgi:hypothetical protein
MLFFAIFSQIFTNFWDFSSRTEFGRLGHYQNISEIQKKSISETRENENFGKKRLSQGLIEQHVFNLKYFLKLFIF